MASDSATRKALLKAIFDSGKPMNRQPLSDAQLNRLLNPPDTQQRQDALTALRRQLLLSNFSISQMPGQSTEEFANNSFYTLLSMFSSPLLGQAYTPDSIRDIVAKALDVYRPPPPNDKQVGWQVYRQQEKQLKPEIGAELDGMTKAQFMQYVKSSRHGVVNATLHILSSIFNVRFVIITVGADGGLTILPEDYTGAPEPDASQANYMFIEQQALTGTLRLYNNLNYVQLGKSQLAVLDENTLAPDVWEFVKQRYTPTVWFALSGPIDLAPALTE